MIKLKEKLAKKKKGSGLLLVMILVFFMITFIVTVGEFYRVHIMQQEIEMHLQRTVNCAVEYAMGDSYRQDKIVNLNVGLAKNIRYCLSAISLSYSFLIGRIHSTTASATSFLKSP